MSDSGGLLAGTPESLRGALDRIREGATALGPRELAVELVTVFRERQLLIQASAIAFRVVLAMIPLLLFGFALLGFLELGEVWHRDIAPEVRPELSHPAFQLIDDAVTHVLQNQTFFWVTAGALITVWEGSGVVRAAIRILNSIYEVDEKRSDIRRFLTSFGIAAAVIALILLAIAAIRLGPVAAEALGGGAVLEVVGGVLGWLLGVVALLVAVGLVVRAAPDVERPLHWVSFGALVVVLSWIAMSLLFGLYLTQIANYGDIFGHLATAFVLLEYVFLSSAVFIAGLVIDSLVQRAS